MNPGFVDFGVSFSGLQEVKLQVVHEGPSLLRCLVFDNFGLLRYDAGFAVGGHRFVLLNLGVSTNLLVRDAGYVTLVMRVSISVRFLLWLPMF